MIVGVRAKNVADARRIKSLLRAGKEKRAEKLARGFVSFQDSVSPDAVQQEVVKAKPGVYVLACFEDSQDHREHTQLGMLRIINIKH
jgi:hypothetical protein